MTIEMSVELFGPRFLIVDKPADDDWIDITAARAVTQKFLGVRTGDTLEVEYRESKPVAVRKRAR